jgi:hypothetical protein
VLFFVRLSFCCELGWVGFDLVMSWVVDLGNYSGNYSLAWASRLPDRDGIGSDTVGMESRISLKWE